MRRCNDIYEIVTVYYPTSCINTTKCPTTTTTTTLPPTTTTTSSSTSTSTSTSTTTSTSTSSTTTTTTTTTQIPSLKLTFDDIANANALVGDASSVTDWNTFFDLPTYGNPFTSVNIVGNEIQLFGGSNITIKDSLFDNGNIGCTGLVQIIDDADCVIAVNYNAFGYYENYGTPLLEYVYLPANQVVGNFAFSGHNLIDDNSNFGTFTILGEHCFYACTGLVNPYFLTTLTSAGLACFAYCTSLAANINFSPLVSAGDYCFGNCTSLVNPDFSSLTTIGISCFRDCTSLLNPIIYLTILPYGCFENCTSLTNPDFFLIITSAGDYCFDRCSSLISINLPMLISLGIACFRSCELLTTVNIPLCTNLGGTVGYNAVFDYITGQNITLTIPSALMICNSGDPDGDIQNLQANNTVTIITT